MHARRCQPRLGAFTLIELSVLIVTVVLLLIALVLPLFAKTKDGHGHGRISCVNNLKNIGLAFRIFSTDNQGKFPWQVPVEQGGVMLPPGFATFGLPLAASNGPAAMLAALSNELSTPRIANCPTDQRRSLPTNSWAYLMAPAQAEVRDRMVSYFIGLSASEEVPASILAGDRNLAGPPFSADTNTPPSRVALSLSFRAATNLATGRSLAPVWTKQIHDQAGNLLLGDGSVQQLSSGRMRDAFRNAAVALGTNQNFVWPAN